MKDNAARKNAAPATVLVAGVSVIDFVFRLDELPRQAEKYRARDAAIAGGGGAANAAVAICRLGGRALLASRLGEDLIGELILADLAKEGVDTQLARKFAGRRSSFSSVFITDAGVRQIVNFRDLALTDTAEWVRADLAQPIGAALADTRWPGGAAAAMRLARERGVPGVLDAEAPVHEAAEALSLASHVAFSAQGLADFAGVDSLEEGLLRAADQLSAWVCVTDGEKGAFWLSAGQVQRAPAYRIDAIDTLGAGDIWHGAFALRLAEGAGEAEAVGFAHAAAAIKCTRFGGRNGAPTRAEVVDFMARATKAEA